MGLLRASVDLLASRRDRREKVPFVPKFPTRTIVLMVLTLFSFLWFFWKTHQRSSPTLTITPIVMLDGGAP